MEKTYKTTDATTADALAMRLQELTNSLNVEAFGAYPARSLQLCWVSGRKQTDGNWRFTVCFDDAPPDFVLSNGHTVRMYDDKAWSPVFNCLCETAAN